ncbi:CMRF35-like molecule 6 [Sinocyclocheilus grahami]|uniref:CMRF35-like molecule 6 n=1 Tax=Sinocyclocheilus grahami TaxID=75366 RepID=UPI0007AD1DBB|nr:PREDICTED: CMRF35-like molecule 6 [Sinocyclocheilus grahami]
MFSMCVVLLVWFSICTVAAGAPVTVTGYRGGKADIRCAYESGYKSNPKYLCKGECIFGSRNIVVKSGSPAEDQRFSLTDDTTARVFTVTITDLRSEDAGQYWCGVDRTLTDVYSEILLLVKQVNKTTEVSTISTFSTTPSYFSKTEPHPQPTSNTDQHTPTALASVAGGLGSVLLVLVLCSGMFLILKKRKRKSGTALFQQNVPHNTESIHMDEIAKSDPGPCDLIAAASSSNQTPASHLNTRPQVSTVYATVTNQKPDSNPRHTHSTNQVTDTDCDYYANIKSPEPTTDSRTEVIYATATHPQNITPHPQNVTANESMIYSVIKHE